MASESDTPPALGLRLYRDLADWYPLLTPVADYAEEAAFHRRMFETHGQRPPRTLLDLGWAQSRAVRQPTRRLAAGGSATDHRTSDGPRHG